MPLLVASYNILADSYIRPEFYPSVPPHVLQPAARRAALLERIERLAADVLCLQEVEEDAYAAIAERLTGHEGEYARKSGRKREGCATFWRGVGRASARTLQYEDETGHVALLVELTYEGRRLGIANTHLKWQPQDAPPEDRLGLPQVRSLLDALDAGGAWMVCGDFNATPDSAILREALGRGFRDAYAGRDAFTCNANQCAKRVDYLLHTAALVCHPREIMPINAETPLPSEVEPSDHLPIAGELSWA